MLIDSVSTLVGRHGPLVESCGYGSGLFFGAELLTLDDWLSVVAKHFDALRWLCGRLVAHTGVWFETTQVVAPVGTVRALLAMVAPENTPTMRVAAISVDFEASAALSFRSVWAVVGDVVGLHADLARWERSVLRAGCRLSAR